MDIVYRRAEEKDYPAIINLIRETYWNVYRPGCLDHYIVHLIHENKLSVPGMEYVAELDGEIVGHIVYTNAGIEQHPDLRRLLYLSCISVKPELQRQGIGSTLMRMTLDKACQNRYNAVLVRGRPAYCKRFGFIQAAIWGIYFEDMFRSEEFFMIKELGRDLVIGRSGRAVIDQVYFPDEAEAAEFDKQFPAKEKAIREGQIADQGRFHKADFL